MVMNLTNFTSAQSIYDIAVYANNASTGVLFNGFMIVFLFVLFLAFLRSGVLKAGTASFFITFFLSVLSLSQGLVSLWLVIVFALGLAIFGFLLVVAPDRPQQG